MKKVFFSRKEFTLVELIAIVSLAALVLSIGPSADRGAARENARIKSCASKLKQLSLGMFMYADENKGYISVWNDDNKHTMGTNDNRIYELGTSKYTPGNKILLNGYMGMNLQTVGQADAEKTFKCPSDSKNSPPPVSISSKLFSGVKYCPITCR